MSIEASLPMLLAIFGVNCSVFGVNTLVMGRLCRSKGIELSRQDIRQMRQGYVCVAVALVCLIVLVATSALSLIDARVGLALIALELVGAGVGAFAAKKSVDAGFWFPAMSCITVILICLACLLMRSALTFRRAWSQEALNLLFMDCKIEQMIEKLDPPLSTPTAKP